MNRHLNANRARVRDRAYRRAVQRLDEALARARERQEEGSALSENERIDRARLALFGHLAE